ncbi:MAG: DnaT-like ssDNA-binding protein [Planctomycetota bacterium]
MPDYTHLYGIFGDGHVRGKTSPGPVVLDPIAGQSLAFTGASQNPVLNTVVRGATSGAAARVTDVANVGSGVVTIELILPFAFRAGETLNFDSGGTATCSILVDPTFHPAAGQYLPNRFDALTNAYVPDDGVSDTPFYDRGAKVAQEITLASGWTGAFNKGDRCTTSAGGAFTVQYGIAGAGGTLLLRIIRKSGTIAATNTVTNTTVAGGGTISAVAADPAQGAWVPFHLLPNVNGQGAFYEFIPRGNGGPSVGPETWLLRKAWEKHVASATANDRGTRLIPFSTFDRQPTAAILGGVSIQTVTCTGAFPSTWTLGETVSAGSWSGKLQSYNATTKRLYVTNTNGQVLAAGTVTGATSGATATASGPAYGFMPGSVYWTDLVAEITAAMAASGALYASSPARWENVFLMIWEAELAPFATGGSTWPTQETIMDHWRRFITALRTQLGRADLPITLFQNDVRSQSAGVLGGAFILRTIFALLANEMDGVGIVGTDGFQPAQTTGFPYTTSLLFLRTEDYLELGLRAWRAFEFLLYVPPPTNFEPLVLVLDTGQSHMVGGISPTILGIDIDPDLYPSVTFPGVQTIDPNVMQWNADVGTWQTFDVALNGNPFLAQAGFSGFQASLAQRLRRRFSSDATGTARVGFIHLPIGGVAASATAPGALMTLDPLGVAAITVSGSYTITPIAATAQDPALGRITATAGTFVNFVVGGAVQINGSLLGNIGSGGNNHTTYNLSQIYRKAADHSWIEIRLSALVAAAFVAETATFTVRFGPLAVWPLVEQQVRAALEKCVTQLGLIPKPTIWNHWQSDADLLDPSGFEAATKRIADAVKSIFAQRIKGETKIATILMQQTRRTPVACPDANIETVIAAQASVATYIGNAAVVSTDKLPMASAGVFPRVTRFHNNIHHTARGYIMAGYLADAALDELDGIPSHPDGDAAVDFGAIDGGGEDAGADSGGQDGPGDPVVVETGEGLANADSYISLAEAEDRIAIAGAPAGWTAATNAQKNDWLRNAAAMGLDLLLESRLPGIRTRESQGLAMPRLGLFDSRTGRAVAQNVVPEAWKRMQVEWVMLLAQSIDPIRVINPASDSDAKRLAIQTTDKLPGGLERSRSYAPGSQPALPILTRIWLLAGPYLEDLDTVGLA